MAREVDPGFAKTWTHHPTQLSVRLVLSAIRVAHFPRPILHFRPLEGMRLPHQHIREIRFSARQMPHETNIADQIRTAHQRRHVVEGKRRGGDLRLQQIEIEGFGWGDREWTSLRDIQRAGKSAVDRKRGVIKLKDAIIRTNCSGRPPMSVFVWGMHRRAIGIGPTDGTSTPRGNGNT